MSFDAKKFARSDFLRADDIEQAVIVTISGAAVKTIGQAQEEKPILSFYELPQGLVLNRSRVRAMLELFGDNTDAWVGQRVVLAPTVIAGCQSIMIVKAPPVAAPTVNAAPVIAQPAIAQPAGVQVNANGDVVFK